MGWIWDKDKDLVGVLDKMNKLYFFNEIEDLINS
jgi:hypothetical protein